jgi:predicted O-methyltransferase YrrM
MTAQWWNKSTPDDFKFKPWLADAAIDFLGMIVKPSDRILEHGSGGSTVWFAKRAQSITSVEDKPEWIWAIEKLALSNVELIHRSVPKLPKLKPLYDLLFVDGEPIENREYYLGDCLNLVKPGGWVILDNATTPIYQPQRGRMCKMAEQVVTFTEVGYAYFVTEFYHLKGES